MCRSFFHVSHVDIWHIACSYLHVLDCFYVSSEGEIWESVTQGLKNSSLFLCVYNMGIRFVIVLQEGTSKFATLEINPKRAQRRHQQQRDLVSPQTEQRQTNKTFFYLSMKVLSHLSASASRCCTHTFSHSCCLASILWPLPHLVTSVGTAVCPVWGERLKIMFCFFVPVHSENDSLKSCFSEKLSKNVFTLSHHV